jgi:hypothetical protein
MYLVDQVLPYGCRGHPSVQQPTPGFRIGTDFGKHGTEFVNFRPTVSQSIDEGVMFLPGLFHPQNVVEQKRLGVGRCESLKAKVRPVDQDLP